MLVQVSKLYEAFAAHLTLELLVARVDIHVCQKVRWLVEFLHATVVLASVDWLIVFAVVGRFLCDGVPRVGDVLKNQAFTNLFLQRPYLKRGLPLLCHSRLTSIARANLRHLVLIEYYPSVWGRVNICQGIVINLMVGYDWCRWTYRSLLLKVRLSLILASELGIIECESVDRP